MPSILQGEADLTRFTAGPSQIVKKQKLFNYHQVFPTLLALHTVENTLMSNSFHVIYNFNKKANFQMQQAFLCQFLTNIFKGKFRKDCHKFLK